MLTSNYKKIGKLAINFLFALVFFTFFIYNSCYAQKYHPMNLDIVKAEDIPANEQTNHIFTMIYTPMSERAVINFRQEFMGCDNAQTKEPLVDCSNPDTKIAARLILETARMDGFLRACNSNLWLHYFGWVSNRVKPVFKDPTIGEWTIGAMHGTVQGELVRDTQDRGHCNNFVPSQDRDNWFAIQALNYFNDRLVQISFGLSFPTPLPPEFESTSTNPPRN